jgi:hypothetical protein
MLFIRVIVKWACGKMIIGGSMIKSLLIAEGRDVLINRHQAWNDYYG